jgi:SAM-dependent methyltransferase
VSLLTLPRRVAHRVRRSARGVSYRRPARLRNAISQPCTFDQIRSSEYRQWCDRLGIRPLHHRKTWEWVYILQVLENHGMLRPGRRGLGFGVGNEPIAAYAAGKSVDILATDLPANAPRAEEWRASGEHAEQLADLNASGLCDADAFRERASFRPVDMRDIPDDLRSFDFAWSSCAMEHLGSLDAGMEFLERQLSCLKPGGIGVHTTEYNVDPNGATLSDGLTVLYQRPQLEELVYAMRKRGHQMRITFRVGGEPEDLHVDVPPFTNTHIRTQTLGFTHTSFGLVVKRSRRVTPA